MSYKVKWILSPKVQQTSDSFFWATRTRQCCQVKQPGVSSKPEKSLVLQDYQPLPSRIHSTEGAGSPPNHMS